MSRKDAEEKHKKNGNKEIFVATKIKSCSQNLCHDKEVFCRDNKS